MKTDNKNLALKLLLRRRLAGGMPPLVAVDFFAGAGRILAGLGHPVQSAAVIECDPIKIDRLKSLGHGLGFPLTVHQGDNLKIGPAVLASVPAANWLDFDAYANPHPLIRRCFSCWLPARRVAVAVTDGGRLGQIRGSRLNLADYSARESALRPPRRCRPLAPAEHELLVKKFWQELAELRGFRVSGFRAAWPAGRRVMYYGLHLDPL